MSGRFSNVDPNSMRSGASTCKGLVNKDEYVKLENEIKTSKDWVDNRRNYILNDFVPNESYYDQLIDLLDGIGTLADYIEEYNDMDDEIEELRDEISRCNDYSEIQELRRRIREIQDAQNQLFNTIVDYCNSASYTIVDKPTDITNEDMLAFIYQSIMNFFDIFGGIKKKFEYLKNTFLNNSSLGRSSNTYVSRYMNKIKALLNEMTHEYKVITDSWLEFNDDLNKTFNELSSVDDNLDTTYDNKFDLFNLNEEKNISSVLEAVDPSNVYNNILTEASKFIEENKNSVISADTKNEKSYDKSNLEVSDNNSKSMNSSNTQSVDYTSEKSKVNTNEQSIESNHEINTDYKSTNDVNTQGSESIEQQNVLSTPDFVSNANQNQESTTGNSDSFGVTLNSTANFNSTEISSSDSLKNDNNIDQMKVPTDYKKNNIEEKHFSFDGIAIKNVEDLNNRTQEIEEA